MCGLNSKHCSNHVNRQDFYAEVYDIVEKIPVGRVLTYGQIARLTGKPQHSRMVGQAMANAPQDSHLPCYRVVNSQGRIAPDWPEQYELLVREGIGFKKNGCVDLSKYLWQLF